MAALEHTAILRTFGVTELLEHILLKLNMADLLCVQRVAKHWRDTIQGSEQLQETLFFRQVLGNGTGLGFPGINSLAIIESGSPHADRLCFTNRIGISCTIRCEHSFTYQGRDTYGIFATIDTKPRSSSGNVRPSWLNMYLVQAPATLSTRIFYELKTREGEPFEVTNYDDEYDADYLPWQMTMEEICKLVIKKATQKVMLRQLGDPLGTGGQALW